MTTFTTKLDESRPLRALLATGTAVALFFILRWSLAFMRQSDAPKGVVMLVALAVGTLGVWAMFWMGNSLIGLMGHKWQERLLPYLFIGPAIGLLAVYLVYPVFNTIGLSLTENVVNIPNTLPAEVLAADNRAEALAGTLRQAEFGGYWVNGESLEIATVRTAEQTALLIVRGQGDETTITPLGWHNYSFAFTSPEMRIAFRNNVLWLVIGTSFSVALGLLVATLVNGLRREAVAKSFIFLPMAISFVGASVIWRFVYAWQPAGRPQIGLLNALVTSMGSDPIPWLIDKAFNNYALIAIIVWVQTGFAMVVLSAALKGVPQELLEAARIDGANEFQIFFRVIVPVIRGAIITVSTTIFISILKVFDIVYVMTSGKFDTEVIANRMFVEMFNFRNFGRASALAVILLLVVVPIMVVNIRNLRKQGINS